MLSTIADIAGIISFLISLLTFILTHTILRNVQSQKLEYEEERYQLQTSLMALRDNIWFDNKWDIRIRSQIRTHLYTYRQKYIPISSLPCIYHVYRAIDLSKKLSISSRNRERLCDSLDFIIARFNITEVSNHE